MGWTFIHGQSKEGVIAELTRGRDGAAVKRETLRRTVVGNVLWTVQRITRKDVDGNVAEKEDGTPEVETFIGCYLLENGGAGASRGWGYKDMCEGMHPYYYSCPLSYLELAPVASEEWRAGVRQYHAERAEKRKEQEAAAAKLEVGRTVKLADGCTPGMVTITSLKPLLGTFGGATYRIPRKMIAPAAEQEAFRAQMDALDAREGGANVAAA